MTTLEYREAIAEVFRIESLLMTPAHRKNTRLIIRHMDLCGQIRAYELAHPCREPMLALTWQPPQEAY